MSSRVSSHLLFFHHFAVFINWGQSPFHSLHQLGSVTISLSSSTGISHHFAVFVHWDQSPFRCLHQLGSVTISLSSSTRVSHHFAVFINWGQPPSNHFAVCINWGQSPFRCLHQLGSVTLSLSSSTGVCKMGSATISPSSPTGVSQPFRRLHKLGSAMLHHLTFTQPSRAISPCISFRLPGLHWCQAHPLTFPLTTGGDCSPVPDDAERRTTALQSQAEHQSAAEFNATLGDKSAYRSAQS